MTLFSLDPSAVHRITILGEGGQPQALAQLGFLTGQTSLDVRLPSFDTAQAFADVLEELLGIPASVHYDALTKELTYHVKLAEGYAAQSVPLNFNVALRDIIGLGSTSAITLDANGTIDFVFGINFTTSQDPSLFAITSPPLNGQLTAPAHFLLTIAGIAPLNITVPPDATNHAALDLINDINDALGSAFHGAGIADAQTVIAELVAGRISFRPKYKGNITSLSIESTQTDTFVTEVGFGVLQSAKARSTGFFLQDVSLTGALDLLATDINALARFFSLGLGVEHGTGQLQMGFALTLKNPHSAGTSNRFTLSELFAGLASGSDNIIQPPVINGSGSLVLPLIVKPELLGALIGTPSIEVHLPDFTEPAVVSYIGFEKLERLRNLNFASVANSLHDVLRFLTENASQFRFLSQKLPLLNQNILSLLKLVDRVGEFVKAFEDNPVATVQGFEHALKQALGLPIDSPLVTIRLDDAVLRVNFVFAYDFADSPPRFVLDVDALAPLAGTGAAANLKGVTSLFDVTGSAKVDLSASAVLALNLGIDVSEPSVPIPYIYDTSSLTVSASAQASAVNFRAALGPIGLFVKNGVATLDGDGDSATHDVVTFELGIKDNPSAGGRYKLSALNTAVVETGLSGGLNVNLPIFAPIESKPLGPLHIRIRNLSQAMAGVDGSVEIESPDLSALLQFDFDLQTLVDGLDSLLLVLEQALDGRVFSVRLPLVGDSLVDAVHFIADLRTKVIQRLRDAPDRAIDTVQRSLFEALGPVSQGGLGVLVDANGDGQVTRDDVVYTLVLKTTDDRIQFNLHLRGNAITASLPINFDIGLPGLGLTVEPPASVSAQVGFDWQLAFGVSRAEGFYLDTSVPKELNLRLGITTPGLNAVGQFGFLQLDVTDSQSTPTNFVADCAIDLKDPVGANNRLSLTDLADGAVGFEDIVSATLVGAAKVDLQFVVSFGGSANFPRIRTDFRVDWAFNPGQTDLTGSVPMVRFENVRLNLGSYLSDFLGSILESIDTVLAPTKPIRDVLFEPLPVISTLYGRDYTLLNLANDFGYISDPALRFLESAQQIATLASSIPQIDGALEIDMGSFGLGDVDLRKPIDWANVLPVDLRVPASADDQIRVLPLPPQARAYLEGIGHLSNLSGGHGLTFPILTDYKKSWGILLGRPVDLFQYTMPSLDLHLTHSESFNVLGPLVVTIGGTLDAHFQLSFGYDTFGLQQFSLRHRPSDVFNGFYVMDGPGPEILILGSLTAGVGAGFSFDFFFVSAEVSVGVGGGLFATVTFDINDPNNDGKLRANELIAVVSQSPEYVFDIHGSIEGHLFAYYRWELCLDLFFDEICIEDSEQFTLASAELVSFDIDCPDIPILAASEVSSSRGASLVALSDSGILRLNVGLYAVDRIFLDSADGEETYVVRHEGWDANGEIVSVTAFGFTQFYYGVRAIVADGGEANDRIDLRGVKSAVRLRGRAGDDTLLGGEGDDTIEGDDGNDVLSGHGGADAVRGGRGSDTLDGGEGDDMMVAGDGQDVLTGDLGDDRIDGGLGIDKLIESGDVSLTLTNTSLIGLGTDSLSSIEQASLTGGASNNTLNAAAFSGPVTLVGAGGDDWLAGGSGADSLLGGEGADTLLGANGDDTFTGDLGNDRIDGGLGIDKLIESGDVSFTLTNTSLLGLGTDSLSSIEQAGLTGGVSNNTLNAAAFSGPVTLVGGPGDDSLLGGTSDDVLIGDLDDGFSVFGKSPALSNSVATLEVDTDFVNQKRFRWHSSDSVLGTIDTGFVTATEWSRSSAQIVFVGNGDKATISGRVQIAGSNLAVIDVTNGSKWVRYLLSGGNDLLNGGQGKDVLSGGAGMDVLTGGMGADLLVGGFGEDQLTEGRDADFLLTNMTLNIGLEDTDVLSGIEQATLTGGASNNTLDAAAFSGPVTLVGGAGNDSLVGGLGADSLFGNSGDDTLTGGLGNDRIEGSLGTDKLVESGDVSFTLTNTSLIGLGTDTLSSIEQASLMGGVSNNTLDAAAFSGPVTLVGGAGNDTLTGGSGNDTYLFDCDAPLGKDTISDIAGIDTLDFSATNSLGIVLNLGLTKAQTVNTNLTLTLALATAFENVIGGSKNDTLTGNTLANTLTGNGGNDTLTGGAGNDTYLFDADAPLGSDTVSDSAGIDGFDFSTTTSLAVALNLGLTTAQIVDTNLTLTLASDTAFENVIGGGKADTITGNASANALTGGGGNDVLTGGTGNDTYLFDADAPLGTDTLNETGGGIDTLDFSATGSLGIVLNLGLATSQAVNSNLTLNLGAATTFENVIGGGAADTLTGNASANALTGGGGNDILAGAAGNDTYLFDADTPLGSDTLNESAGGGTDTLDFSATTTQTVAVNLSVPSAQVVNTNLTLTLSAGDVIENAIGGSLNDALTGNALANTLTGAAGNDALSGGAGNDSLAGGAGDDTLTGGDGNDIYSFDADLALGSDTITETVGTDTINFTATTTKAVAFNLSLTTPQVVVPGNLTLTLGASDTIENLTGGTLDDVLIGNALANTLTGGLGNDTLTGNDGNDVLVGSAGNDLLTGGNGDDKYTFDADSPLGSDTIDEAAAGGTDTLDFSLTTTQAVSVNLSVGSAQVVNGNLTLTLGAGDVIENVTGGSLNDTLTGNGLANMLTGGAGNDALSGASGNDMLIGGVGNDTLTGGDGDDTYSFDADAALGTDTVIETATGGVDLLDFSQTTTLGLTTLDLAITTSQVVNSNLTLSLSSGIAFELVVGTAKDDTIRGNSLANVLIGGAGNDTLYGFGGRDLIVGGTGADSLWGGDEDDILIAGKVAYYDESTKTFNRLAIDAIMAEWGRTDADYPTRISRLRTGGGLNGSHLLNGLTVLTDGSAIDSLFGEGGLDWFWKFGNDSIGDQGTGGTESVN